MIRQFGLRTSDYANYRFVVVELPPLLFATKDFTKVVAPYPELA